MQTNPYRTATMGAPVLLSALLLCCALPLHAEIQQTAPPDVLLPTPARAVDITFGAQHLTRNYGPWRTLLLRGVYELGRNVLQGEFSARHEFGEDGIFLGVGNTHTFDDDWFGTLSVGAGDGAFFLPRYRIDGAISRKLLPQKNLVASVGGGYYKAPDGHRDRSLSIGAAYYFTAPVVLEGGVRFNRSNPGSVDTHQQFLATSIGRVREDLVTARVAWGGEGYQAIGPATSLVGFNSTDITLSWRHWLSKRTGFLGTLTHYRNPNYERSGIDVGAFFEFE